MHRGEWDMYSGSVIVSLLFLCRKKTAPNILELSAIYNDERVKIRSLLENFCYFIFIFYSEIVLWKLITSTGVCLALACSLLLFKLARAFYLVSTCTFMLSGLPFASSLNAACL